jgi:putative ABC transport system permease protein
MNLFSFAWKNLKRNLTRTLLTIFSVAIAVTLLVSFLGLNEGYTKAILKDVNQLGAQLLAVPKGCPYEATALIMKGGVLPNYLPESAIAGIQHTENVNEVYGFIMGILPSQSIQNHSDIVYGVTDGIFAMKKNWGLSKEVFTEGGVVLGFSKAAKYNAKVGDTLVLSNKKKSFRVVAVLPQLGAEDDHIVYAHLKDAQFLFGLADLVSGVAVTLKDPTKITDTATEIEKIKDVQVVTMDQVLGIVLKFINTVKVLLLGIIAIAIFISGLQILNSLLMSIMEQIKEFGVFKAIGANNNQIRRMVIYQTFLVTLLGSLAAIVFSILLKPFLDNVVRKFVSSAPQGNLIVFLPWMFIVGIGFAILIGFLASLYPAWKASSQVPAKVIHMEVQV